MSEEEIIEKAEEELEYGENCTYKYLLGQILKLYQKEKEKNKELEKKYNDMINLNNDLLIQNKNSISKDKIRAKIKEIEKEIHIVIPNEYNKIEVMNENKNEGAINVLQELLLEEN